MNNKPSIPSPCFENWQKMKPNNDGRFCGSCAKTVVDFTSKSDLEISRYLNENSGQKICGHFKNSQLEIQPIKARNHVTKFSKLNPFNYFASLGFTLIALLSSCREKLTGEVATPTESQELNVTTGLPLPPKERSQAVKDSADLDSINDAKPNQK